MTIATHKPYMGKHNNNSVMGLDGGDVNNRIIFDMVLAKAYFHKSLNERLKDDHPHVYLQRHHLEQGDGVCFGQNICIQHGKVRDVYNLDGVFQGIKTSTCDGCRNRICSSGYDLNQKNQ